MSPEVVLGHMHVYIYIYDLAQERLALTCFSSTGPIILYTLASGFNSASSCLTIPFSFAC
jgi:hypothetical protein